MRILLITPVAPYPPTTGGRQRTNVIASGLRQIANVDLFLTGDIDKLDADAQAALQREWGLVGVWRGKKRGEYWPWSWVRRLSPIWIDRAAALLGRRSVDFSPQPDAVAEVEALCRSRTYDAIVCRYLSSGVHTGILLSSIPKIVDLDDLDTQVLEDRLALPALAWWLRLLFKLQLWQLQRIVNKWIPKATHVWVSCPEDVASVTHRTASVLPNMSFHDAPTAPEPLPAKSSNPVVLIVGTLNHPPNVRGIDYFLERVWPRVLDHHPRTQLRVVGGGLRDTDGRRWAQRRNVTIAGFVESVAAEYRAATVVAVPILEGGGTKIKVLEALQFGCAVVATRHSLRGYMLHLRPGESLLISTNADDFSSAIVKLLEDDETRERLAHNGQMAVKQHYSRDIVYAEIDRVIRGLR